MKIFFQLSLMSLLLVTIGCKSEDEGVGGCTMNALINFQIGVDVTNDFNVSNVPSTLDVLSSSCPGVPLGPQATIYGNVTRVGNTLTFSENGNSFDMNISGNDIDEMTMTNKSGGCTVKETANGVLNPADNDIDIMDTVVLSAGCL